MASPGYQHCANCIGTLSFPTLNTQTGRGMEGFTPSENEIVATPLTDISDCFVQLFRYKFAREDCMLLLQSTYSRCSYLLRSVFWNSFYKCRWWPSVNYINDIRVRSHVRCALLRCAGKTLLVFLLAKRSIAQCTCERPFTLERLRKITTNRTFVRRT